MTTLLKGLEVNEKDSMTTAFGKGMMKGAVIYGLSLTAVGGLVYLAGKLGNKDAVQSEVEVGE